jgi:4-hydroxybenzoate polyprenyltransferase
MRRPCAWSFAALAVAIIYPYAKRFVSMPQAVLGVAFSFGIPMAFAATQSRVPALAWVLLAGQPVLGAGLRHRIRHGGPRR